jgi:rubredoxin---NAD+ reductase
MPVAVKTPALPLAVLPPPATATGDWQVDSGEDGICALHLDKECLIQGFALTGKQAAQRSQFAARIGQIAAR